jgi:hypothetical protein
MLNRFFEGLTSGDEEQALYRFFNREDLPEHLIRYKPVFKYFETHLEEEAARPSVTKKRTALRRPMIRRFGWISLVAAVATGCIFLLHFRMTEPFDPYEGSYIIRNGVRIADTKLIRPELEKTIHEALRKQADMECLINELTDPDDVFDQYKQALEQQQNTILSEIIDPYIKEEARKILTSEYNNF